MTEKPAPSDAPEQDAASDEEYVPQGRMSIFAEFMLFMKENKAYWMAPILIVMLLLVLLAFFGSTAASPFIYTLF